MAPSINKQKACNKSKCSPNRNGKGDKPRPVSKKKYNKNYESINWKKN